MDLPTFTDIKQNLAALKNLDEPVNSWDSLLLCILYKKLDVLTNRAFQMERDSSAMPTIDEFLSFLERRSLSLENTDSQRPSQRVVSNVAATTPTSTCLYCPASI
ncbi:uncharacterized protein LOC135081359 [Ostrinia nubilalis]|uniref:uncharacterized protein LOC135081219 n=1 Tax=Ostrinia nubilalis TaxID=29057 RepID=UPI0030825275